MSDKLQVNEGVINLLLTLPNLTEALETFINAQPEEHRAQLAFDYGQAIQEKYNNPTLVEVKPELQITQDLGRYSQSEIVEKADTNKLQLLKCPTCGGMHFRHAGYVLPLLPFSEEEKPKVGGQQTPVYVCVKDRTSFIHHNCKIHIVSDFIDLEAWEKFEKVAHKATGAGGEC